MKYIDIDICCNDPDNGNFIGRLDAITVGGLRLESNSTRTPKIKILHNEDTIDAFKISRLWVPILSYSRWVGNWFWDSIRVEPAQAIKILNYAPVRKNFCIVEGEESIYDLYKLGAPFKVSDLEVIMEV